MTESWGPDGRPTQNSGELDPSVGQSADQGQYPTGQYEQGQYEQGQYGQGQYPAEQYGQQGYEYGQQYNAWAEDEYPQQYAQRQPYAQQPYPQHPQDGSTPAADTESSPPATARKSPTVVIAAIACTAVLVAGSLVAVFLLNDRSDKENVELSLASTAQSTDQPVEPTDGEAQPTEEAENQSEPGNQQPARQVEGSRSASPSGRSTQASRPASSSSSTTSEPEPEPVPDLSRPSGARLHVSHSVADTADEVAVVQTLADHGDSINTGDYSAAFNLFTSGMQSQMKGLDTWSSGLSTSYWDDLTVNSVSASGDSASVTVRLQTTQSAEDGHNGQTCSVFSNTYSLSRSGSGWKISDVDNSGINAC